MVNCDGKDKHVALIPASLFLHSFLPYFFLSSFKRSSPPYFHTSFTTQPERVYCETPVIRNRKKKKLNNNNHHKIHSDSPNKLQRRDRKKLATAAARTAATISTAIIATTAIATATATHSSSWS